MLIENPLNEWLEKTSDSTLLVITHDRKCCDALASVVAFEHYAKLYSKNAKCIFAKPHSHPMTERLYNDIVAPLNIMHLGEIIENTLEKEIMKSTAIFALDTSSTQNCTYMPIILSYDHVKEGNLQIYSIDHHEKGFEDISELPYGNVFRIEEAQSVSAFFVNMLNQEKDLPKEQEKLIALYLGTYQDVWMLEKNNYSDITKDAFGILNSELTQKSKNKIEDYKMTPYPINWQTHLENALAAKEYKDWLVYGVGIIDNPGIVSYIADGIMNSNKAENTIVLGIIEEYVGPKKYLDIVISGRSKGDYASSMPILFSAAFYTHENGRSISRGGGKVMGTKIPIAACAASIALPNSISDLTLTWDNETKKIKESLVSLDIPRESIAF